MTKTEVKKMLEEIINETVEIDGISFVLPEIAIVIAKKYNIIIKQKK